MRMEVEAEQSGAYKIHYIKYENGG
ncbi:hypothetical protein BsWGS_28484 [Bradybaena similaris]